MEENKNEGAIQEHHDHNHDHFLEGMSSLLNIEKHLCTTLTA